MYRLICHWCVEATRSQWRTANHCFQITTLFCIIKKIWQCIVTLLCRSFFSFLIFLWWKTFFLYFFKDKLKFVSVYCWWLVSLCKKKKVRNDQRSLRGAWVCRNVALQSMPSDSLVLKLYFLCRWWNHHCGEKRKDMKKREFKPLKAASAGLNYGCVEVLNRNGLELGWFFCHSGLKSKNNTLKYFTKQRNIGNLYKPLQ